MEEESTHVVIGKHTSRGIGWCVCSSSDVRLLRQTDSLAKSGERGIRAQPGGYGVAQELREQRIVLLVRLLRIFERVIFVAEASVDRK